MTDDQLVDAAPHDDDAQYDAGLRPRIRAPLCSR